MNSIPRWSASGVTSFEDEAKKDVVVMGTDSTLDPAMDT